jgi:hypothetical protein
LIFPVNVDENFLKHKNKIRGIASGENTLNELLYKIMHMAFMN